MSGTTTCVSRDAERHGDGALELGRYPQHARQQSAALAVAAEQTRAPARAAFVAGLELAERVGARPESVRSASRASSSAAASLGSPALEPLLLLGEATCAPWPTPLALLVRSRRASAGCLAPRRAFARRRSPEEPLLVLELPPPALELHAPLMERLGDVPQPGLLRERLEERILCLLDRALERHRRSDQRREACLGRARAPRSPPPLPRPSGRASPSSAPLSAASFSSRPRRRLELLLGVRHAADAARRVARRG